MDQEEASKSIFGSLIKSNIYAAFFSILTGLRSDLVTALILFPVYLYLIVSVPYLLQKGYLSEHERLKNVVMKFF